MISRNVYINEFPMTRCAPPWYIYAHPGESNSRSSFGSQLDFGTYFQ